MRASQDLNQASLDRTRLEKYLADVKTINDATPKRSRGMRSCWPARSAFASMKPASPNRSKSKAPVDEKHRKSRTRRRAQPIDGNRAGVGTQFRSRRCCQRYIARRRRILQRVCRRGCRSGARPRQPSHRTVRVHSIARSAKKSRMESKLQQSTFVRKPMSVIVVGLPAVKEERPPSFPAARRQSGSCDGTITAPRRNARAYCTSVQYKPVSVISFVFE